MGLGSYLPATHVGGLVGVSIPISSFYCQHVMSYEPLGDATDSVVMSLDNDGNTVFKSSAGIHIIGNEVQNRPRNYETPYTMFPVCYLV